MPRHYKNWSRTYKTPTMPYEKERLDKEMEIIGKYGLKTKKEVWRLMLSLARIRKAARELLILDENDPKRIFEGAALMRRMYTYGFLDRDQDKLDYVLGLTVNKFLERRLQTKIFKSNQCRTIHEARVKISHRHIRVGKQMVNIPSFMVKVDSERQIDFAKTSPHGEGRPGRCKRKKIRAGGGEEEDDEEED